MARRAPLPRVASRTEITSSTDSGIDTAMADDVDHAQQTEALHLAHSLQVQQLNAARETRPNAAGHCLNRDCLEPFDDDAKRLFCGPRCADSHHRQQQHSKR